MVDGVSGRELVDIFLEIFSHKEKHAGDDFFSRGFRFGVRINLWIHEPFLDFRKNLQSTLDFHH